MRKKILGTTFMVAMMAVAGYNVYLSQTEIHLSELTLANVEALAEKDAMTNEEYIEKTGCSAVMYESKCTAKDGSTHRYAEKV